MNESQRYLRNWLASRTKRVNGEVVLRDDISWQERHVAKRLLRQAKWDDLDILPGEYIPRDQRGLTCDACGRMFAGITAFDKHRIGHYGRVDGHGHLAQPNTRRCMTDDQMRFASMRQSGLGVWTTGISHALIEATSR